MQIIPNGIIPSGIILFGIKFCSDMKKVESPNIPFLYGVTVSLDDFANRIKDREKLYNNLTGGINTTIISPRRWGKSSLVEKVVETINKKEKSIKTVVLDLFTTETEEQFLEQFAKAVIKASSAKWEDWLRDGKSFFKHLIPKFSVGLDPNTDFSISFDWQEALKYKDEVLDLPQKIATAKGVRFIICLDEFQSLSSFSGYEHLEKRMRALWQRQKQVTYCLLGSKRHMMSDLFNNPSKPFYRFGDIIFLKKIDEKEWVKFITRKFKLTGKVISPVYAKTIPHIMKNHSWYVQQFSHYVWQKTDEIVNLAIVNAALEELIYANMPFYQREMEGLSASQVNFLRAVANGENKLTSKAVMEKYRLGTPRNVLKNKEKLMTLDIVDFANGEYELLDPAFELWFMKQYYNKEFKIKEDV